jgi:hypothetical protein
MRCPALPPGEEQAASGATLANKTRSTFQKRQKELSRQAHRKDKQARRLEARQKKAEADTNPADAATTEDPDIVGIDLGPQPPR